MKHQWLAVRCCCTPKKIFGFMLAPEGVNSMRVLDGNGGVHDLQIKELCDARLDYLEEAPVTAAPQTTLKVERAFYSEDRPIEFWRDLSGFIEAKS